MKHAVHTIITPSCRRNGYPERYVAQVSQGNLVEAGGGPATSFSDCYGTGTDQFRTSANQSPSQVYLAPLIRKWKYEDMTSSKIDVVEPENDHELSSKLSFFRENKRRKPPEAGNRMLMQVQVKVQDQGEDGCQGSKRGSSPRSGSTSRVLIAPEVCGESDLTAENLMADESSRSSNTDGSSKFESAAESVSKGSIREPPLGSSLGVLHSFLDQPEGKTEVRTPPFSEASAAYQRSFAINDDHISGVSRQMEDVKESEGVAKLEPASFRPLGLGSTQPRPGTIHSEPSSENEKWLQLGVGSSRNTRPSSRLEPAVECHRESPPFQQGNVQKPYGKRKAPSFDFQVSESREPESFPLNPTVAASIQWQAQRGSMPYKLEPNIDSSSTLNAPAFVSLQKSSTPRTTGVPEIGPNYSFDKDLCLFGSVVSAPVPQLVFAHTAPSTREHAANASERNLETMSSLFSGSIHNRHPEDPQGSKYPVGAENMLLGGVGKSGMFNRAVPSFVSRAGDEVQFRSPQTATDHSLQFPRESRHTSVAALIQTTEDQRQAAAGHSWLSASDSAHKLIPLANNFQGWSSDMSASTRAGTGSDQVATARRQMDLQLQRDSDDWGSLFRRVSSSMLVPSQVQVPDVSSRTFDLDESAAAAAGSIERNDSMGGFKRAIRIQNRPQTQWTTTEPTNLGTVASWCLNGGKPLPGSRAEKLESFGGDRPVVSPMVPERLPVQGRYPDIEQILSTKQASQRQSWQPAAGQPTLQQGNVTIFRGSRSAAPTVSKPRFQLLPPRGTSHAGLWFILQSAAAENQPAQLCLRAGSYLRNPSRIGPERKHHIHKALTLFTIAGSHGHGLSSFSNLDSTISEADLLILASAGDDGNSNGQLRCKQDGRNGEDGLPQISKAYLRIKDGKMPVSAVKKYLVTKLGLASEAEVEITCRGQPVVPNLPLQHVRDVIWYSSLNRLKDQTTTTSTPSGSGDRDDSTSAEQRVRPAANCNPAMFSKDVIMVLTYQRHPRTMPPQHC